MKLSRLIFQGLMLTFKHVYIQQLFECHFKEPHLIFQTIKYYYLCFLQNREIKIFNEKELGIDKPKAVCLQIFYF